MVNYSGIFVEFDSKIVLSDVSIALGCGEKAALIGRNGAGKTTLLRVLAGELLPENGAQRTRPVTAYVAQDVGESGTVSDAFAASSEEWQRQMALEQLGLGEILLARDIATLSGGQRTRLAIAAAICGDTPPDVLLFDEPTNNLDADGQKWLRNFVLNFSGVVIFASHDRAFINQVATQIIELENGKTKNFKGNYEQYKMLKNAEFERNETEYAASVAERKKLENALSGKASMHHRASKEKYDKGKHGNKLDFGVQKDAKEKVVGAQMRALKSRLVQIDVPEKPVREKFYMPHIVGARAFGRLLAAQKLGVKIGGKQLFNNLNFEILAGQRLRIIGKNGAGKTTLLNILAGKNLDFTGEIARAENLKIGYMAQGVTALDFSRTVLENLLTSGCERKEAFKQARSLNLHEKLRFLPEQLSRGQQSKLAFARLLLANYDMLILDEATNHVDIATRELLEAALQEYASAIVYVTHDEYFADKLGGETLALGA